MFIGIFPVLSFILAIAGLVLLLAFWRNELARTIGFMLVVIGSIAILWFELSIHNAEQDGVGLWSGTFDVRCLPEGSLRLETDGSFTISSAKEQFPRKGNWKFILSDDMSWIELYFGQGEMTQVMGTPDHALADYVPQWMGGGSCELTRRK